MYIRIATLDDVRAISDLFSEFFTYNAAQQPEYYAIAKENGEYPTEVIHSCSGDIIVAEIDQVIVGFVHVEESTTPPYPSVVPHKFADIVDFIIKKQYRRNGIGHALLKEVKNWAKSRNLEYLELMVLDNNVAGRVFYEQEKFIPVSHTMRMNI